MTNYLSQITLALYLTAISSVFLTKNSKIWGTFIILGITCALFAGHISLISLPFLLLIFVFTYAFYKSTHNHYKILFGIGFIGICAITLLNKIPGVNNWKVIDNVLLTPDAIPLNLYFNFDAALIGLAMIAFGISTVCTTTELKNSFKTVLTLTPIMLVVVILCSIGLSYVVWAPKWTPLFFTWSISNLFFTCVIEETIFRRFIQKGLQNTFVNIKYGNYIAILIASLLFGLAHYAGGILYICLASIAGLFYGLAYYITGRIEASIACHYILNAVHFIFFTYPVLASAV